MRGLRLTNIKESLNNYEVKWVLIIVDLKNLTIH